MMISPEWYCEEKLKGKIADQIRSRIRSMKRKIHQLETRRLYIHKVVEMLTDTIEHPNIKKGKTE